MSVNHLDHLRTLLVDEPRGHDNMCASFLVPSTSQDAQYGVVFMDNGGSPAMCGHGTVATCTSLVDTTHAADSTQTCTPMSNAPAVRNRRW